MSRRPKQTFICHDLEELARQLLFVPPELRAQQVRRAEELHDQLDPAQNYPFDFLKFRITGHRSVDPDNAALLVGQAVLADLRLLIDSLSRSLTMTLAADEAAMSVEECADAWQVSTRTIARWRTIGLRWRWVSIKAGDKPRLMILRSAAQAFVARQPDLVQRAASFTQMTHLQKQRIIDRARRLALAQELSLNQAAAHLARRTGRSQEAIRQLLMQHDHQHPERAIFVDHTAPLSPRQQEVIARAYRMGVRTRTMARHFDRTHSTIYRAIRQRRAGELRKLEFHFISAQTYSRDDADQVILRSVRLKPLPCELNAGELPEVIAQLFTQDGLDDATQQRLLVQFNYLKYKASTLRDALDRYEPRVSMMDQIDQLCEQIRQRRNQLVRCNLQVVLSVAQRHLVGRPQSGPAALAQLLELGATTVYEAIEQYDPHRNEHFKAYLTYRLQRRFALVELVNPKAHRRLDAAVMLQQLRTQAKRAGVSLDLV